MAKQPPRDDDQPKKPNVEQPPAPKTPKRPVPNMSLDEPAEKAPLEVEEVFEEDVPVVEAAAASDVAAVVAAHDEVIEEVEAPIEHPAAGSPLEDAGEAEEIIEEAAPASDVKAEDVLFDEAIAEAVPASEAKSAEVVEEPAEAVEEVSSATRKAEAVLDDEIAAAEVTSAAEVIEEATAEEAVMDADAEAVEAGSSAVLSDVAVDEGSAVKQSASGAGKTTDFDKTVGFEPPSSATKKTPVDRLVTEEEVIGTSEASAVDLGDMPARKGSSVAGIDKVAEALESGVDIEGEEAAPSPVPVPSVEFDELLDDAGAATPAQSGKPAGKLDDSSTEMDAAPIEEADDEIVSGKKGAKKAKKDKPAAKATGDDIEVDEYFGEAETEEAAAEAVDAEEGEEVEAAEEAESEAAEAFDAEEAAEAEAAEAFDAETEAAEAFGADEAKEAEAAEDEEAAFADDEDEKPKKKTKADKEARTQEEDEDEDEEASAKKKKKDMKDRAMPAPAAAQTSTFLRVFVGMFLATIMVAGGAAAGWFFAPDQLKDLAKMSPNATPDKKPPPPHVPTKLEQAHEALDQGKFQEAIDHLTDPAGPAEFSTRGEARWLAYFKDLDKNAVPDGENPKVKEAVKDLEKGENKVLLAQVKNTLGQKLLQKNLNQAIVDKGELDEKLRKTAADKDIAEKRIEGARQVLVAGNFIKKNANFDGAVLQKILKGLSDDRAVLAGVNQVLAAANFKSGAQGIREVLKRKKDADDSFAAVNKVLENEKTKGKGDKGVLEIVDARNKMAKDRDDLVNTITAAFKELVEGKIVPEGADPRKAIVTGTKLARQRAESPLSIPLAQLGMSLGSIGSGTSKMVEQSFDMAKVFSELGYFRTREPFIQTPAQKMNNYIALLQDRKRNNPKELADMSREADWVLSPQAKASDEARAKARYVQGLALRNQEKFAEAKTAFDESLKMIPKVGKTGAWSELARKSHKELVNPNAYYLPRIDRLQAEGNLKAALDETNLALKAMPEESRLFAQRGLIRYELVRGKGPKVAEAAQSAIRADANSAGKNGKLAAEAAYIVGLLEEELGNWDKAEKLYRQAIEKHSAKDDAASKYRFALGRLLLRDPEAVPAVPAPAPADGEKKKKDDKVGAAPAPREHTIVLHPWTPLVVSSVIAQPQPLDEIEDKEALARLNETLKLAEELIASKNDKIKGQGYLLKGSALSKLGKRTEGLKEYSKGLKLIYPGIATNEMTELIQDHPAFQQPDVAGTPNPLMAERHFGEGMHLYWSKQYAQAEAQFRQAVKYYDKDARYQYFLGLAQIHQKTRLKRDAAIYSFEQGARLEAKVTSTNPDAVREINASLERIQGELRQYLNSHRYKAMAAEPEAK